MASNDLNLADQMVNQFFSLKPIADSRLKVTPTATGGLGLRTKEESESELQRQMRREDEYQRYTQACLDDQENELRSHLKMSKVEEGESQTSQFSEVDDTTTIGALADLNELQQEEAAQVYDNYYRSYEIRYDPKLVITRHRQLILSKVNTHPVVIIRGTTGCGKTTQVPQYILDEHAERGKHCNIAVTQPRRIAAVSVARRVCQERAWELGRLVGYQIALDSNTCPDTRITYMTTGVLLQKLICAKNMHLYTHVIIDEVHERDQDTDLVLLVVRKFLRTNSKATKVILMSATIDTDLFASYFQSPVQGKLCPAPTVDIEHKPHNVSEHYITELHTLGEVPLIEVDTPCIKREAFVLAVKLIITLDRIEEQEWRFQEHDEPAEYTRGSVLVFLPGYDEIAELRNMLAKDQDLKKWWILPLHSSITREEQQSVFNAPAVGRRKIILSTNIAESSITVPDIRYVIDFCLTKILINDPETNYCSLQVQWASKANCEQRKGRAGRVSQGKVYRMVPSSFYDRHLEKYGIPEMRRCPLELVVLKIKRLEMEEPKAILALALERPNLIDIDKAILVLKEVGAMMTTVNGVYSPSDGDLTFIGQVMAQLPLDVHISKLILLGFVFNCLEECIIMAASLSVVNFFSKPFQEILKCYKSRLAWASDTFSDVLAFLAAYTVWQKNLQSGYFNRMGDTRTAKQFEETWAKNNYIQLRRIYEVKSLVDDLKKRLSNIGIKPIPRNYPDSPLEQVENVLILKVVICGAFFPNYFLQEDMDEKDIFKQVGNLNPRNTVVVSGLPMKHGFLYESAVVNLFRVCSPHVQVMFEDQKAYVQFGKSTGEKGTGVLQEVYIALKMRHQRKGICVPQLTTAEVEERKRILDNFNAKQEAGAHKMSSSRKHLLVNQTLLPRIPLPAVDKVTVRLHVTHVVDCGHFWAQYLDSDDVPSKEAYLEKKINMYQGRNLKPINYTLERGMLVLAPWREAYKEIVYYRACIEDIPNSKAAEVFFLDYGNTAIVPITELRDIDTSIDGQGTFVSDMLTIPALAVQCKLSEIRPAANKTTKFGHWSKEATEWFKEYVYSNEVLAAVYSVVQGVIRLQLVKVTPNGEEVNINKYLVQMHWAEKEEEDYMSKQNHSLRVSCQTYSMDMVSLGQLNSQQQEENVLKVRKKDNIYFNHLMPRALSGPGYELQLRGPMSPLEVSYCGITKLTSGRRIKIERDSVNSVTLNREPQNLHKCMLVSCCVAMDSSGSAILARNTTEMPSIHGLPALMTLLFCPQAEFRTDPERSKYIGAIAGLGVCPNTTKPIYPEHDIELVFDTTLDHFDVVSINTVRICMNVILGSSDVGGQPGPAAIKGWQEKARKHLFDLLTRPRQYQEPMPFRRKFAWNQVHQDHLIPVPLEVECTQLFRPHLSIELNDKSFWIKQELKKLEKRTSETSEADSNRCPICYVTTYTRSDLRLHLISDEHIRKFKYFTEEEEK